MAWSTETIVAIVTLLVTAPSSLLVIWTYIRRDRRPFSEPYLLPDHLFSMSNLHIIDHPELLLESGLMDHRYPIVMGAGIHLNRRIMSETHVSYWSA